MAIIDKNYHKLINVILSDGFTYEDPNRKGVNRIQIPSYKFEHDFRDGFPAITTKKLYWKGVVGELIWFLNGDTNIKYLLDNGINIWNKDAYNNYLNEHLPKNGTATLEEFISLIKQNEKPIYHELGDLGRVYGAQWRDWTGFDDRNMFGEIPVFTDQITNLVKELKENPMGTKHIVTAWNPAELDKMALPPCHWSFEILVEPMSAVDRVSLLGKPLETFTKDAFEQHKLCDEYNIPEYKFTLKWHQRSVDTFLGLPFNIASYALLAQIIGKMVNMVPKGIEGDLSNVHIYEPHIDAVKEQLSRSTKKHKSQLLMLDEFHYITDKEICGSVPTIKIIKELRIDMFTLDNYDCYPAIKAEMLAYNK